MCSLQSCLLTRQGLVRSHNEDRGYVRPQPDGGLLLAVADGMGGASGGEIAAEMAVERLDAIARKAAVTPGMLPGIANRIQEDIREYAARRPGLEGMGTTLTAAVIGPGEVRWLHVGDSRLYLFRKSELRLLTRDHRFLTELLQHGDITPEEAKRHPFRNVLDQCLGCPAIAPDTGRAEIAPGDALLLCTDGLYGELEPEAIAAVLAEELSVQAKAEKLLEKALSAGAKDDITLIVAAL